MITYSRFQEGMIRVLGSALLVMGGALVGVGCERQGPVEKAGKQVDQAVEAAKDKLNPEGPVEKAVRKWTRRSRMRRASKLASLFVAGGAFAPPLTRQRLFLKLAGRHIESKGR